ncbi:MAG: hypothetical protein A3E87_07095 [Gammaproteobacteria bacterium RIFCSPHIGHO2_12_FULL_35_23]|nr:MAG: hypothetical protein A3E87_07095 [Gammaproteobacteria bacterium RIFCSPHIGHO2_12_FULL_35_23]
MGLYNKIKYFLFSILAKKTLGVRALIIENNQVLLIKHTYQPGWCTIGGGVKAGETPAEAICRELKEEVGAMLKESPKLFAVYHDGYKKYDDYIIFYLVGKCEYQEVKSWEIKDKKWFSLQALPLDISPATLRRVEEYLGKAKISDRW